MLNTPVIEQAEKKNGTSVQGRYQDQPGFDAPMTAMNPFTYFTLNVAGMQSDGIPVWSYYPQVRDAYLRILSKREPIMSGALYSVVSRIKSLRWEIKGGRNSKKYYQRLFAEADGGAGYGQFISKVVTDLLTQDNGAFIELVGAGRPDKPLVGRVTEIHHLDAAQCWRTFDPEYPVIYTNPLDNTYHRMHRTRVIMLSSNPQPDERGRNIGFCAVSRALKMMQIVRHVETYKDEKISGKFKRAIIYGGPLTRKAFNQNVTAAEEESENANMTVLNEIPVVLSTIGDLKLGMLDLASLPDGFDYEKEINIYVYILALCFATDAREFWPATASGATKADATVQHLKAQGKGIGDIITTLQTAFNWQIMPSNGDAELEYDNTDDEQDKQKAEIDQLVGTNIAMFQANGWISPVEGRSIAISRGLFTLDELTSTESAIVADDAAPMQDDMVDQAVDESQLSDEFDTTVGAQSKYNPETRFVENKHPRANNGRFGSGSSTPAASPAPAATTPAATPDANAGPLAKAILSFLGKTPGKLKNNRLSVPGETKDRSAELQAYLQKNGFPNAKVKARKTKKGYTYSISGVLPKKPRKTKTAQKANPETRVDSYQKRLEDMMTALIDQVADNPDGFQGAIDGLYDDFADNLPQELTDAFGVGLAGEDATDDGIEQLTNVGQTSVDYFKDSFIVALRGVSLAGLGAKEIREALNSYVSRIGMYAGAAWESVWQGQRDATSAHLRVRRVLDDGAKHCNTCPAKAKTYDSYDDMVSEAGVPGDGSDDCLSNCRCKIEVESDDGDFGPLVGTPTVFTMPLFEVIK